MERHYSDLSWRISALSPSSQIPHKSESSTCVNQLISKPTLEVPLDSSMRTSVTNETSNCVSTNPAGAETDDGCHLVEISSQSNRSRRLSLNLATRIKQYDQNNGVMTNQCNIEVVEDSSGSDSEVEALLMGKSAANKFASSFPSPTVISNVVRNMWNITSNTKVQGPKITITRAPTIDQSELEFLYPIPEPDEVVPTHQTNLKSADSPIRIEVNGFSISSRENSASTTIATLKKDTVCSKSVQTDRRAFTETTRNGFYNGLFGNVCCEEVII